MSDAAWTYDDEAGVGYLRMRDGHARTDLCEAGRVLVDFDIDDAELLGVEFVDSTDAQIMDEFIAKVRRDAQRGAAQMIRDACDRWEVDGDDERLVNAVLDPWTSRILNPDQEDDR